MISRLVQIENCNREGSDGNNDSCLRDLHDDLQKDILDNLKRLSFSSVKGLYPEDEVMPVEGTQHYLSRSDNKLRANKQLIYNIDTNDGLENVRDTPCLTVE